MSIPVVTVGDSREDLVGRLERLHGPVSVVRRCSELAELLAACQSGLARAAVVAEGSEELTASLVDRLSAVGVAVVALTDSPEERARLQGIGVAAEAHRGRRRSPRRPHRGGGGPAGRAGPRPRQGDGPGICRRRPGDPAGSGGGCRGGAGTDPAPGRSLRSGVRPDRRAGPCSRPTWRPNWLPRESPSCWWTPTATVPASRRCLGLLDEAAGLAQACRLADQGLLDAEALLRIAAPVVTRTGTFRVLTGITRADRWTELRAAALALVLARARQVADVTVIDTGFCLETDEELSFDTMAPRRNAATLRSLELADTVFAVGAADPIGVPRLVRGLAELAAAVPQASPAGGPEQGAAVRRRPLPGAATARGLGAVRPRRTAVGLPAGRSGLQRRGPARRIAAARGRAGIPAPEGHRRAGLCTRPAKPPILCTFFHSEASAKGLGSP